MTEEKKLKKKSNEKINNDEKMSGSLKWKEKNEYLSDISKIHYNCITWRKA